MNQGLRNKDRGNALQRYIKSFFHSIDGILYTIRYEHNVLIMIVACILVVSFGLYFQIEIYEWLFCLLSMGLVCGCEMINSAIEATVDLVTTEYHPLAKIAKDTASAASLVFVLVSFIGGLIIFVPKVIELLM